MGRWKDSKTDLWWWLYHSGNRWFLWNVKYISIKLFFKCQFDIKIKSKARTMTRDKEDHFIIIKDQCMKIYNPKHDAPYNRTSNNIKVKTYTTTKRTIQL